MTALLCLLVAACGARPGARQPPAGAQAPRGTAPPARTAAPPARPLGTGKSFPECDPRHGDPDRGRAALGLIAGDCQDDLGRNAAYVTRLVTVLGAASPAGKAGVKVGDRIVRLDACEVSTTHELARQLGSAVPGWVARLVVERNAVEMEIFVPTVRMGARVEPATPHLSTAGCAALKRRPARP